MKAQVTVITLLTNDVPRMTRFYRDVLGFPTIVDSEEYVEFANSGVRLSICSKSLMAANTNGHPSYSEELRGQALELCFPCVSPEQVHIAYENIIANGGTAIRGPALMPWGHTVAFFADPEGNIHSIYAE
ncbi:VOC family protein [Paenibacillus methanolicus]|uniref:Catechol 2,3-dioxygenase-like lactoylglutathione lyase family enzyme n=1 Tax=Paenibacillus methanolicus TaxID=582686 RepID=A0A5S5CKB5_9BACL|nr:VOC family protein [Paenibacillus methanolicus]TYP79347.1 catechol 2,3-dioxygenase-like lactoylglutathione lyase family enzyme [Paenibacillus methanolicus]